MPYPARRFRGGYGRLRGKSLFCGEAWIEALPALCGVRPRRVDVGGALRCWVYGIRGRLRWWSFGAFGSNGRHEGGQYRAGRRAPPLLCW